MTAARLAAAMAFLAFAICLAVGGLHAGNTFTTTVSRALLAMGGTFVIGLIVGAMGQKMLDDNKPAAAPPNPAAEPKSEKNKNPEAKPKPADR